MKKYKIGYTQGVYDMFHIGHLNIINQAKKCCEYLVVGVNSDRLVEAYKNKKPIINENDRLEIVKNLKAVDDCIIVDTLDKVELLKIINFNVVFIGDDWKGSKRWSDTEQALKKFGIDVVYLPHTDGISSTILRQKIDKKGS